MKKLFGTLLVLVSLSLAAQEAAQKATASDANPTRPRSSDELNKESSSFVPDPDSLDPLPVKNENLKEDEEPVLEDIRQVLDGPSTVKAASSQNSSAGAKSKRKVKVKVKADKKTTSLGGRKNKSNKIAKTRLPKKSHANLNRQGRGLTDDEPDLRIENNFHLIFKTYNAKPTSAEGWSSVLKGRDSESYLVQKNDTLWSISKTLFGDPNYWPKLWSLNKGAILNPHLIRPGLQVVFYSGSADEIPSMALADADDPAVMAEIPFPSNLKKSIGRHKNKLKARSAPVENRGPSPIPDSLPLSRNDRLFIPPKVLKVEFLNQPDIPEDLTSDIILTDRKIVSEVEVSEDEISKGRCGGDHVLKTSQLQGSEGILKIYESLQSLETDAGDIFPYRYVGQAQVLTDKKIRITTCTTVISPSLFFVSPSRVDSWRTSKTTNQEVPTIIGSPNIVEQVFFTNHQIAYINLGAQPAEVGQSVSVQSQLTDRSSGEIRILDKFGSFAIGLVTNVQDLIETGDEIRLK